MKRSTLSQTATRPTKVATWWISHCTVWSLAAAAALPPAPPPSAAAMGKFRKLGRHAAHRVSMLRSGFSASPTPSPRSPFRLVAPTLKSWPWPTAVRLSLSLPFSIPFPGQDYGVAAGEAWADRDHRREGSPRPVSPWFRHFVEHLAVGMQVFCARKFDFFFFSVCCFLTFQAKEVRTKADQMVQLGKEVYILSRWKLKLEILVLVQLLFWILILCWAVGGSRLTWFDLMYLTTTKGKKKISPDNIEWLYLTYKLLVILPLVNDSDRWKFWLCNVRYIVQILWLKKK